MERMQHAISPPMAGNLASRTRWGILVMLFIVAAAMQFLIPGWKFDNKRPCLVR